MAEITVPKHPPLAVLIAEESKEMRDKLRAELTREPGSFVERSGRLLGAKEVCPLDDRLSQIREVLRRVRTEHSVRKS